MYNYRTRCYDVIRSLRSSRVIIKSSHYHQQILRVTNKQVLSQFNNLFLTFFISNMYHRQAKPLFANIFHNVYESCWIYSSPQILFYKMFILLIYSENNYEGDLISVIILEGFNLDIN